MNRKTAFRLLLSVFLNAGTQLSAQDSPPPLSADEGAELRSKFAARGLPTSLQELDDWYRRVPEGKNAADWFEEASMRLVHAQGERQRQLPVVGRKDVLEIGDALDDETARLARAFLNENRTALKYAREGAVFEESRYPIDLKLGYEVPLPHLAPLRDLARTLYLESLVLTHDGHTEGAVDSVRVMYAIARSLESEPVLASQTVRIAIESMTTSMFSKNLSARPFSPAELDEVSRLSKSDVGLNSCYRAFVADALTATFQPQGLEGSHHQVGDAGFLATYLEVIEPFLDAFELPLRDAIMEFESLAFDVEKSFNPYYQREMSQMNMPEFLRYVYAAVQGLVYRKILQVIVGIEKYRLDHGTLPAKLELLVPTYLDEIPGDPYNKTDIAYAPTSPGYIVYSVGINRLDENGERGDLSMRVTR